MAGFALALEPQLAALIPTEALAERAIAWLRAHQNWLVVLDNVTSADYVRPLIAAVDDGRFVITTRRATGWGDVGRSTILNVLDPATARELLQRAVGKELGESADALSERMGYLPLALEQAAAYMAQSHVSAADYLRLLAEYSAAMYARSALPTAEARTIAGTWSVTLARLSDDPLCGHVIRVLAWFAPEEVPLRLLAGLAPEPQLRRALIRLAAYSMIDYDGGVVSTHPLVLAVARTADEHETHRSPELIDQARIAAVRLLRAALPNDSWDPGTRRAWRELTPHVESYVAHASSATDDADTSVVLTQVATFFESQGVFSRAVSYRERALEHDQRRLGPDHPDVLRARNNLAHSYDSAGDIARAIPLYERTLADYDRVLGPDHPVTLRSRNNLATAYGRIGDVSRSIAMQEQAATASLRVLGPEHPDTLASRNNLAYVYQAAGDLSRALSLYEVTLSDSERVLGPDHPSTLASRNNLAAAYEAAGDLSRALPLYEATLAERERILGPEHPNTRTPSPPATIWR